MTLSLKPFAKLSTLLGLAAALSLAALAPASAAPKRWVMSDKDTQVLILGTVPFIDSKAQWLDSGLESEFSRAKALVLDLSPEQQDPKIINPLVQQHAFLPEDTELADVLSEADYAELNAIVSQQGLSQSQFAKLRPWFAAITITAIEFARAGNIPTAGVDFTLITLAKENDVDIRGLTSAEDQVAAFAALSPEQEKAFLLGSLAHVRGASEVLKAITSLWVAGETDMLTDVLARNFSLDPSLKGALIDARTQEWQPKIEGLLDEPGLFIVAISTSYLTGEDGLIARLEKAGHTVSAVN